MKRTKHKWYIKTGIILLSVLLILSIVPYLIPVTEASSEIALPYEDSQQKTIKGIDIHYREWLPGNQDIKGKILLVHGLGSSIFCWRYNVDNLLQEGYMVLAVDLPGFGHSDRSRGMDHSQENRADILWELISEIDDTSTPWVLAGHSMGGGTVTAMAIDKPERTKSLILIDGALFSGRIPGRAIFRYPPAGRWLEVIIRHQILREDRISAILESAYKSTPTNSDVAGYFKPLFIEGTERSLVDMVLSATSIDEEAFRDLTLPVFAIWGEKDTVVPLSEANRLQQLMPRIDLKIIPEAGHCPMETHSDEFNELLLESLAP